MTDSLTTLFRPVGLLELELIFDSGMKAFPPRLPEQPIFYPVMNLPYARQIAKDWNAPSAPRFVGYVTKFDMRDDYLRQFSIKTVGGTIHQELWVPAKQLVEFNSNIRGEIQVVEAYFGEGFIGYVPDQFGLKGKSATDQLVCLAAIIGYSGMDFICETAANAKAVFLNYPFWLSKDFSDAGVSAAQKKKVLDGIFKLWRERNPKITLCGLPEN